MSTTFLKVGIVYIDSSFPPIFWWTAKRQQKPQKRDFSFRLSSWLLLSRFFLKIPPIPFLFSFFRAPQVSTGCAWESDGQLPRFNPHSRGSGGATSRGCPNVIYHPPQNNIGRLLKEGKKEKTFKWKTLTHRGTQSKEIIHTKGHISFSELGIQCPTHTIRSFYIFSSAIWNLKVTIIVVKHRKLTYINYIEYGYY